jgi:radical SAM superfamily enzyme YgiQ (UPF0313 family)
MLNQVLLITINSKQELYSFTADEYAAIQPNIYMSLLASYIKSRGVAVETIDETSGLSIVELCSYIHKYSPKLIGVVCSGANPSSSTMSMVGAIKFFNEFNKNKGQTKTFICGGHPTAMPERTLKETGVDFVVMGEGYETIVDIYNDMPVNDIPGVSYVKGENIVISRIPPLIDVNILPKTDWHAMNPHYYRSHNWHSFEDIEARSPYAVVWTSFGCPYTCSFCCINNLFGSNKYRLRNIETVLEEIDVLVTKYGVKNIKILDELFVMETKRIRDFIEGLRKRGYDLNIWAYARVDSVNEQLLIDLKEVGLKWIAYGMESVSEKILSGVNKGCKRATYDNVIKMTRSAGINICADFIVGLWEDDYDTLKETYDFAVQNNFEWFNIYPAFAYPGTELYKQYISQGRKKEVESWEEYSLYGYKCNPLNTQFLSSSEVLKWRDDKFIEYHSRPEYLDMIRIKFGQKTVDHIVKMTAKRLQREITQ